MHGSRVSWEAGDIRHIEYTEREIRERVALAIERGATYARAHKVSPRHLQFYGPHAKSPSGVLSVGISVPKTPANQAIVSEMLRVEAPGCRVRGQDY
ncbi:MAG: hypothetical protein GWN58_35310 [Anaerolineae bacterium]|nr:hypothetical protein [Anaerolineae bacterium]